MKEMIYAKTIEHGIEIEKDGLVAIDGGTFLFSLWKFGKSCDCCDVCKCKEDSIVFSELVQVDPKTIRIKEDKPII